MREFWTWFVGVLFALALIALGFWGRPAHAEPAGTLPACTTAEALRAELTGKGAAAWPIEGLRGVRLLAIVNGIEPRTNYRADSVLASFGREGRLTMFLI